MRVFVSSTFRDMQDEREELIKRVFPQLRRLCEERGVSWGEVDLRWGITDKDAEDGRVLPICLAEIDYCRPFFIGLLGHRYGWIPPDSILASLAADEQFSWLNNHKQNSVTELEIRHGALNHPPSQARAFFYYRNDAYLEQAAAGSGRAGFQPEGDEARLKLDLLKDRIRQSGFPVREYASPVDAGRMILADLKALIEELFPAVSTLSQVEEETAAHRAWAEKRSEGYIGREEDFERLDAHTASDDPPLIVTGKSGAGKSALLAAWAGQRSGYLPKLELESQSFASNLKRKLRKLTRPSPDPGDAAGEFIFTHFIGATARSADRAAILRRVMTALKDNFDLPLEIPANPQALPTAFANFLSVAAARGRLVLIIDGLDQLADRDSVSPLAWLPDAIPAKARLIISAAEGWASEELQRRRWPMMKVDSLKIGERERLIIDYLGRRYRKKLGEAHVRRIASARQAENPLYLRTLLEELRVFGVHEEIPDKIADYLRANSTEDLYTIALARYEKDYEGGRQSLTRDAMRALWAARHGLGESELLDLLGKPGDPLPMALWSPLHLAARESFINRDGILTFFDQSLRKAVEREYLADDREKNVARRELADYFASRPLSSRKIDELPWQLTELRAWQELAELLSVPEFLDAAWRAHQFEIKAYWAMIEGNSELRLASCYRPIINSPEKYPECLMTLSLLLSETGYPDEALSLTERLVMRSRGASNLDDLQAGLGLRAVLLKRRGRLREALEVLAEQERICRRAANSAAAAANLGNQAVILQEQGLFDEALLRHREEEMICRQLQDEAGLAASLGNQAIILQALGDIGGARKLMREQERICRQIGDLSGLQKSLGNQAILLAREDKLEKALNLHQEEERLCRRLLDLAALQACLGNQAIVYEELGDYDQALELLDRKEQICSDELKDPSGLARTLTQKARLFAEKLNQLDYALPLAEKADKLAAEHELIQLRRQTRKLLQWIRSRLR